ncbi:hypothetical protein N9542_02550 [Methylophilaceae bacterium]|nr:hypothetical protein [Methylophilaceae bacterium]
MANQQQKLRTTKQTRSDDEIDLFELLHFFVKGSRYWLSGGLIFALMALIYALALYPSTYLQQTINDIRLNQESLSLVRQVMPAILVPLEDKMQAQELGRLFNSITKGGQAYLDKTIYGISGVDMKDRSLDSQTKGKIETVVIRIKGDDQDLAKREIDFIRNNIRGVSQYLAVKKYLDNEIINGRIDLFNTESQVNKQKLNYERASRQLLAYQNLENESNEVKDMQIILNLSNEQVTAGDKKELNNISDFSGAKYLPLSNRIVALKSEMADQMEAVQISELQIEALKLSQKVLNDLVATFNTTPYQGDVIQFSPMIQTIADYRQQNLDYTREEIAALDNLELTLIDFDRSGFRFFNNLPMQIEKKGRLLLVIVSGFIGAFLGFLYYTISSLVNAYSRRYKN